MTLRYVDPAAPKGLVGRTGDFIAQTRAGRGWAKVSSRVDPVLLRKSGGKVSLIGAIPSLHLLTANAQVEASVVYFNDGDDVILIASNYGLPEHAPWYLDLQADPRCLLNGTSYVASEITDELEYERMFRLAARVTPVFHTFRDQAEAHGRHVPLLRLSTY